MTGREPVRLGGWTGLAVGLALQAAIGILSGVDWRVLAGSLATLALAQIAGLEWARDHVWPSSSHQSELNAARQMRRAE